MLYRIIARPSGWGILNRPKVGEFDRPTGPEKTSIGKILRDGFRASIARPLKSVFAHKAAIFKRQTDHLRR
jgi:hypothetical protein